MDGKGGSNLLDGQSSVTTRRVTCTRRKFFCGCPSFFKFDLLSLLLPPFFLSSFLSIHKNPLTFTMGFTDFVSDAGLARTLSFALVLCR